MHVIRHLNHLTSRKAAQPKVIIGKYPYYQNLASELGVCHFRLPVADRPLCPQYVWRHNERFLASYIARGAHFLLLSHGIKRRPFQSGGWLGQELRYLHAVGIVPDILDI